MTKHAAPLVADALRLAAVGGYAPAIRRGIGSETSEISAPTTSGSAS